MTRLRDFQECPERYRLRHEMGIEEPPVDRGRPDDDCLAPAALDWIAHRLLERTDFALLDQGALGDLLRADGIDPERPQVAQIIAAVRAFLATPLAASVRQVPPERRLREVPFSLGIALGDERRCDVTGRIDLVVLTAESARVLDYKPGDGAFSWEAVRFELASYALAVRQLIGAAPLPMEVCVVPLGVAVEDVQWTRMEPEMLTAHAAELKSAAGRLVDALATNSWPRLLPQNCRRLGCGFFERCHAGGESASASA